MQRRLLLALALLSTSSYSWSADSLQPQALLATGEYQQALTQIDSLLKETPEDTRALFLRAVALEKLARSKEASVIYQRLISEFPELPEPHNNLAVLYARQGDYHAAEQVLQSAIKTHPSYATAHNNLSNIYKTLASNAYNKALNLNNGKQPVTDKPGLVIIEELHSYRPPPIIEPEPVAQMAKMGETSAKTEAMEQTAANTVEENNSIPPITVDLQAVEKAVQGWGQAWSQQDSEAYLAFYSETFRSADKLSRSTWAEQRRTRLQTPSFIRVNISQLETSVLSNEIVSVQFSQRYQSDRFRETSRKLLLLKYEDDQWRILQETEVK